VIQLLRVGRRFPGGQVALDEVTFDIAAGEFVFLTGDSGAGKTTLLSLIYRAQLPTSGSVLVNGRNVGSLPRKKVP
jgi:cell division transport system ATP-binding protein